jgi:hypothetical protein
MEEILAIIGIGAIGLWALSKINPAPSAALVSTPAPAPPTSNVIPGSRRVSGGYKLASAATMLSTGGRLTAAQIPSTMPPPALPAHPPIVWGGIAGNAATGGNPLGGSLRPGITAGPATTVVGASQRFFIS